jgi:hypothetical protein
LNGRESGLGARESQLWATAKWRKSTHSADAGCVEIARIGASIGVRDTKDAGGGPVLVFTQEEWTAFLSGVQSGEFDLGRLAS